MPGATLVMPPSLRKGTGIARRPAWLAAIKAVRAADAVFWNQAANHPDLRLWGLAYAGLRVPKFCYSLDPSQLVLDRLRMFVSLQRIALCFVTYREAVEAIKHRSPELPVEWLPPGFSRAVFQDRGLSRDIDVLWVGRREERLHESLLRVCAEAGYTYRYSQPGPPDPATTEELSELVARARYYVVTPPGPDKRVGKFQSLHHAVLRGARRRCEASRRPPALGRVPGSPTDECDCRMRRRRLGPSSRACGGRRRPSLGGETRQCARLSAPAAWLGRSRETHIRAREVGSGGKLALTSFSAWRGRTW